MNRQAAARSGVMSGAAVKAAQRYASDYAMKDYNEQRQIADQRRVNALNEYFGRQSEVDRRRQAAINERNALRAADDMRRQQAISESLRLWSAIACST